MQLSLIKAEERGQAMYAPNAARCSERTLEVRANDWLTLKGFCVSRTGNDSPQGIGSHSKTEGLLSDLSYLPTRSAFTFPFTKTTKRTKRWKWRMGACEMVVAELPDLGALSELGTRPGALDPSLC